MSGSELEFSESSNSAQSVTDSAYSSPAHQQVPSTGIPGVKDVMRSDDAHLTIILEPDRYTRIRYKKELENSTHGCLLGRNGPKTYPTVELVNYTGKAVIVCHLVQDNEKREDHPHKLVTENHKWDNDISKEVPENDSYTVCFGGMLIVHTPKKEVVNMLLQRNVGTHAECTRQANAINLKVVRLRFSAYDIETKKQICPPVYSEPIKDSKSPDTNNLEICRHNRVSGNPRGGDDMFFFVEKVKSNNIKIRFFELNNYGDRIWSTEVSLIEKEVHRQYAIFFRTPAYKDTEITSNVKVFMELYRPTDGHTSSPKEFTYIAEPHQIIKKRRFISRSASAPSTTSGQGAIVQGVTKVRKIEALPGVHQMPQYPGYQVLQNYESQIPEHGLPPFKSGPSTFDGGMQSVPSETPVVQGGIQTAEAFMQLERNYVVQFQQNSGRMPQDGFQSVQNTGTQYPQDGMPQIEIRPLLNNIVEQAQYGYQMVHQGVVHPPLATGAQLPYSPESENILDELGSDSKETVVVPADSSINIDDYLNFPTPHQSRANSIEPATGAQSSISETHPNSNMINDPILGRAAAPDLLTIEEEIVQNLGACAIDSQELSDFAAMDFEEYFESFDLNLLTDSGRASVTTKSSKNQYGVKRKGVSAKTSKKTKNEQDNEYTAYYNAEDGIEVKKLIKEICEIVKKEVYKKQDVRCKLERLFELRLSNGDTFLHMALICNIASFEYITRLIQSMRMPQLLNLTNDLQQTILHLAVMNDLPLVVASLLDKGCDPMLPDLNGNNAIHHAVMCQSSLKPFATFAFDLNAQNFEKQTALHLAVIYDSEESARTLLQKGASYNARDIQGRTPLHLAVYDDRLNVTRALLDYIVTSEIDAVDGLGYTALQIATSGAIRDNTLEIINLLLQKKADPMYCEGDNSPAWKLARRKPQMWLVMKEYAPPAPDSLDSLSTESSEDEFESADEGDSDDITTKLVEMKLGDKQV